MMSVIMNSIYVMCLSKHCEHLNFCLLRSTAVTAPRA